MANKLHAVSSKSGTPGSALPQQAKSIERPYPGAQTMEELCAGPAHAPEHLSADQLHQVRMKVSDIAEGLDSIHAQIGAMVAAVGSLLPSDAEPCTALLPDAVRYNLAAVRVLLNESLRCQIDQLDDWVGGEVHELGLLLKGGAA